LPWRAVLAILGIFLVGRYLGVLSVWATSSQPLGALLASATLRTTLLPVTCLGILAALAFIHVKTLLSRQQDKLARLAERKRRSENARARSEARYRSMLDNAPTALAIFDEAGKTAYVNRRFGELFGYTREDIPTQAVWCAKAFPEAAYRQMARSVWQALSRSALDRNGDIAASTYRVTCKDGSLRQVEISASRIGNEFLIHFHDVTEQMAAESALRTNESRLRKIFERIEKVSVQGYNEQLQVTYWNKASSELYGYREEEAIGRQLQDLILPDEMRAPVTEGHRQWLEMSTPIPASELMLRRKNGSYVPVFSSHVMVETQHGREMYCIDIDLTEIKRSKEQLELAASVFSHSREGIVIASPDGRILNSNATFSQMCGYTQSELLNRDAASVLLTDVHGVAFQTAMTQSIANYGQWSGETWNRRKNGDLYAQTLTINAIRDERGEILHLVILVSDVTALREQEEQLKFAARHDALTGLPNRTQLAERVNKGIERTNDTGLQLALIYIDLDDFKAINDALGSEFGDKLLMTVTSCLKSALRPQDVLARMGGDEFVAMVEALASPDDLTPVLDSLLRAFEQELSLGNQIIKLTASLGATLYAQGNQANADADQLLRQADLAMYQAKLSGKARYCIFDTEEDRDTRGRHESREAIRHAIEQDELRLYYQPKVNLRTGKLVGCEALIRWQHPERGLLLPSAFLPSIEGDPLAIALGEWVMTTAIRQAQTWRRSGNNIPVSINVGARELLDPGFENRLSALLSKYPDVPPSHIELEVLEGSALNDFAKSAQVIRTCQEIGVKFAIDDFGTGYSSLTYLKLLPVETLKIDQSFVREMLEDLESFSILEGIVGLAKAFSREMVAEGVETDRHAAMLLRLGCNIAQGYGIARPMPAEDVPVWSASWSPQPDWLLIKKVRPEDIPVLRTVVEQRGWLLDTRRALMRGQQPGDQPMLNWFCFPNTLLRHSVEQAWLRLKKKASELAHLAATGKLESAMSRFGEAEAACDELVLELLAIIKRGQVLAA
jgi:diguanylate cyclase (GGDEF)-like protein/PAS domain S-box-containing protein